jgi:hypothetical protein
LQQKAPGGESRRGQLGGRKSSSEIEVARPANMFGLDRAALAAFHFFKLANAGPIFFPAHRIGPFDKTSTVRA